MSIIPREMVECQVVGSVLEKIYISIRHSYESLAFATMVCSNSKTRLVITSLSSCPLTPVFRSRLSASAAALALAHMSGRHRSPALEGAHAVPGLLPHCLGSPALHGWTAAREACLLAFCLAMRVCFGGPSAVEALVGLG